MIPSGLPFSVIGELPDLDSPTMLVMMTGWIDASGAAAGAMEHIISETNSTTLIEFDPDTFIDYRARRPTMELREGVNSKINWAIPEIRLGQDAAGVNLLLLTGPEPDTAWRLFASTVAEIAQQMDVKQVIGLGAYPYGAPHTRPVCLTATSIDPSISARLSTTRNTLNVPAGVEAIIEHALHKKGIPSMTLWAQIPHYVATMAYPSASAALIEMINLEAGLSIDSSTLRQEAGVQRERLDQLVLGNPEHGEMLIKLEAAYDEIHGQGAPMPAHSDAIPTVDELAAEVEQFLRDQQLGGTQ